MIQLQLHPSVLENRCKDSISMCAMVKSRQGLCDMVIHPTLAVLALDIVNPCSWMTTTCKFPNSWAWRIWLVHSFGTTHLCLRPSTVWPSCPTIWPFILLWVRSSKCSPGQASKAQNIFFQSLRQQVCSLLPAPRMLPAHRQSDSVMKDTEGIKDHVTWKSALLSHPTFALDFPDRILSKSPFSAACNRQQHGDTQYLIHWSLIGEETSWELALLGSILVSGAPSHTHYSHNCCWFTQK